MEYQKEHMGMDLPPHEAPGGLYGLARGEAHPMPDHGVESGSCHATCDRSQWCLYGHPLAMVYAPCQAFKELYDPEVALSRGTLFSELDLPLEVAGGRGGCQSCQRRDMTC